jgi:hypothetical protein
LSLEIAFGGLCYAGLLLAFSRAALRELTGLVLGRRQATGVAGA